MQCQSASSTILLTCQSTGSNILLNTNNATRVSVNGTYVDINTKLTLATIVYSSINGASVNASTLCLYDQRISLFSYFNTAFSIAHNANTYIYWRNNTTATVFYDNNNSY